MAGHPTHHAAFDAIDDGIIVHDPDTGAILDVNDRMCEMHGYTRDEFVALEVEDIVAPDPPRGQANVRQLIRKAAAGERQEFRQLSRQKEGDCFWVNVSLCRAELEGEARVVATVREDTCYEQALRQSEERYRRLFKESQEGITITSPGGRILDVNPAACTLTGYNREELVGMKASAFYGDAERRQELIHRLREEGRVRDMEVALHRKDGEQVICQISAIVWRDEDGEIEAIQSFMRDVTEQKRAQEALRESEEKFRALAEEALIGISLIQDGRYKYVNETHAEIFGYDREEMVDSFDVLKMIHPGDRGRVRRNLRRRLEGEIDAVQYQARGLTKEQNVIYIEIYGRRIMYQGRPAIISCVLDVTQQRRLEEELLQIQEEERRRFGRELHDGLASDLTGVALISSSLARKVRKGKQVTAEELEEVVEFINEGIEEARSLSRGMSPVGLEQGLAPALEELAARAQRHDELSCSFEANGPLPELPEETATHLYRIAQEAVRNAVKHAEADHVWVRLTTEDKTLTLDVQDDGQGCPELPASKEGLGMRTMRYRANLTGSTLIIEEAPEGGTLVRCRLSVYHDESVRLAS